MYEIARGVQRKRDHTEAFLTFEHPFLGTSKASFGALLRYRETLLQPGSEWTSGLVRRAEIVTLVREGTLLISNGLHAGSRLEEGGIHCLTAGPSAEFQVRNLSETETSSYCQIWLDTRGTDAVTGVETSTVEYSKGVGGLVLLASGQGETTGVSLQQDIAIYLVRLRPNENLIFETLLSRRVFLAVIDGVVRVENNRLVTSDSAMIRKESLIEIAGQQASKLLLVDLP
jgi:redox-sensitive bicupin YhaK (pirin superfamily)